MNELNLSRFIDKSTLDADRKLRQMVLMSKALKSTGRQIVGVSLQPETARAFKAEAARRGLSVKSLFEEMWADYQRSARNRDKK